jgi:hypothetical protein
MTGGVRAHCVQVNNYRSLGARDFFSSFWIMLDLTIICSSFVAIVYYVLRLMATNDISDNILETGGNVYIKLQVGDK